MGFTDSDERTGSEADGPIVFGSLVDWAIGAVLGIVGVLVALGGGALYYSVDRPAVAEFVRNAEFRSDVLTEAQAIDALVAFAQWSGLGLVAAGVGSVLLGIGVVVAHRRARNAGRRTPRWILGVVGALVGSVLSFVPFSPVLGGALAGYLDPDRDASGLGVGLVTGVLSVLWLLVVGVFASVGLLVGLPSDVAVPTVLAIAVAVLLSLAYFVALSAVGGYLGAWVRNR